MKTKVANRRAIFALLTIMAIAVISGTVQAQHYEHKEHHLGPTGLFGITSPINIKITKVQEGSPAEGKINVGDVIVGAGGTLFKTNTRPELAAAIDFAETQKAGGVLTLKLQDGKKVDLQLKVLGSYSDTAPYDCPKTDAIITQTADYLVASKKFGRGSMNIGLLGLLATGEQKYIDVVKEVIHQAAWAKPDIELSLQGTSKAWDWGYTNLLLCEYYLLTGDEYVLPTIKAYSVAIAQGRDAGGLWGHRMADPEINGGKLHGRLHGYAVMNQSSLPLFISLLLADKCGIKHPEIQAGIKQTHNFYNSFIGRGTLPYGVHNPYTKTFNNNGMSGSAAVAFSIYGNKRGVSFFSSMSAASHNTLETGHTGHFFNQLWTGLGADLAGPKTSAAFFNNTRWLHTLNRTWNGSFTYDGCGYKTPSYSYRGLSDAGSHLLNYCLGRHKLYITGRDADQSIWLNSQEGDDAIALASLEIVKKSDEQLLAMFGHPMPKLREGSLWTLRSREHDLMDSIKTMLTDGTDLQRSSAIAYFGYGCPKEQVTPVKDDLASIMRDLKEDIAIRAAAAGALCWLGEESYPYFNDMLTIIVADKTEDALGAINEQLAGRLNVLSKDPFAAGLVTDKDLFYKAVHKLLDHRRMSGRGAGLDLIANIPLEDFYRVGDKVMHVIKDKDTTYHSYHNPTSTVGKGLVVFANLNIDGGIELAFDVLERPEGKWGFKLRMLAAVLPKYGHHAKPFLPKFKPLATSGRFKGMWDAAIKEIESSKETTKMISFDDAMKVGLRE